jgi:hypothetical protein
MAPSRSGDTVRPSSRWIGLGLCLLAVAATAPAASASIAYPVDLKSCVREAGYAFAGTVSSIRAEKVPSTIVTKVAFSNVVYAKGKGEANTIVLTMHGGEVDGMGIRMSPSLPEFHVGERCIVLAASDLGSPANGYLPIVYFNKGVFRLRAEKPGGRLVVGGETYPVIGYREGHLVYADRKHSPPRSQTDFTLGGKVAAEIVTNDNGRRYTEKQFLDLIRKVAAEK